VGEVARLMSDAGLIVLSAFISPFRAERDMVRAMVPDGEFFEIFIDTPLSEAEKRDVKGLYAKARAGELKNFTGIDSPYEPPERAEIHIDTTELTAEAAADRIENIRRVGEVARLMSDAGLIVLSAFISPFRAERDMVRAMVPEGEFFEIFVDTPLADAEKRDVKGLYAKARAGELKNFTGIDSPYEAPQAPEMRIDTTELTADQAADRIVEALLQRT
jgi:adenylylsulfate kinase-like enzyme